jgi:ribosomal protein S13
MSLKDELTEIRGIGEATAEEVLAVVQEHGESDVELLLQEAIDYYNSGKPWYARKFVEEAKEEL